MATQSSLIENRTIRVFISSTFSDMDDERTELMKKTFPRLRVMAAKRDVTLTEVDLRWGITKEESESGKVVDICLREIQNSIPFFIGIIGNRYGWIPSREDIEESTFDRFNQLRSYVKRKLSVTDMEMQFGVLEHKDDLHAFFYINDNKEEHDNNPEKLADLKRAVRLNGRYPVSDFSSPEDLAKQVEEAFACLLDELFPENHSLSFLEKERISQRSFLNQLCQSYVPVKENFEKLDNFLSDENQQYLIVTGESGLGKSALVANWVKGLSDKKQTKRKIIYHFIGNGGSLGSHHHVVKTLCAELKDQFKLEPPFDEQDREKWGKDNSDTLEMLYNQISVDKDGCLIVLDAVNQLVDVDNAKSMRWLGFPPLNVKVLITTLKNDVTIDVFKRLEYSVYEIKSLGIRQRRKLVKDYLKNFYGKRLTDDQVTAIINDRQSSNTLVLKTLLDELVSFGSFDDLEKRVQYYLEPDSIPDFYQRFLERFEEDLGRATVSHALSLILLSRDGLPEDAITEITKLTHLHWSQLYCSLISHLNVKMGLVNFSHRYFSEAIRQRYITGNNDDEKKFRREIISFYQNQETDSAWVELGYQYEMMGNNQSLCKLLMREDTFGYFYKADVYSLTRWWNRLLADPSAKYRMEDYLTIEESTLKNSLDFYLILSYFTKDNCVDYKLSLQFAEKGKSFAEEGGLQQALVLTNLGISYSLLGNHKKSLDNHKEALSILMSVYGENNLDVASSYNSLGHELSLSGNQNDALNYYVKALNICLQIVGEQHPCVASLYNNIGIVCDRLRHREEALDYELKALSIRLAYFGEKQPDVAISYNNVGRAYGELGNRKKALEYEEKALGILLAVFGETHPKVAAVYNNLGGEFSEQEDHNKALAFFEKALKIRLKTLGRNHQDVALSYNNIGCEYSRIKDYSKSIKYLEEALSIWLVLDEENPVVATLYSNIGSVYGEQGEHKKALDYYVKALKIGLKFQDELHTNMVLYKNIVHEYIQLGNSSSACGDHKKALDYYEKALVIMRELFDSDRYVIFILYDYIGFEYGELEDYQKALEYRLRALELAENLESTELMANISGLVGQSYKALGNIDAANDYFRRAAEKWKELGNEEKAQKALSEMVVS